MNAKEIKDNFLLKCLNGSGNYYDKTNPLLKRLEDIFAIYQVSESDQFVEVDTAKKMEEELTEIAKEYNVAVDTREQIQNTFEEELKDLFGLSDYRQVKQEWIDIIMSGGNLNDANFETEDELNALIKAVDDLNPQRVNKLRNLSYTLGYSVEKERKAKVEVSAKREEISTYFQHHRNEVKTHNVNAVVDRANVLIDRFREAIINHDKQVEILIDRQSEVINDLGDRYNSYIKSCDVVEKAADSSYATDSNKITTVKTHNERQQASFSIMVDNLNNSRGVGYAFGSCEKIMDIEYMVTMISKSIQSGNLDNVIDDLDYMERQINKLEIIDIEIERKVEQSIEDSKKIGLMMDKASENNQMLEEMIVNGVSQEQQEELLKNVTEEDVVIDAQENISEANKQQIQTEEAVLVEEIGAESKYKPEIKPIVKERPVFEPIVKAESPFEEEKEVYDNVDMKMSKAIWLGDLNLAKEDASILADNLDRLQTYIEDTKNWAENLDENDQKLYGFENNEYNKHITADVIDVAKKASDVLQEVNEKIDKNYEDVNELIRQINQKYAQYEKSCIRLQQEMDSKEYVQNTLDRYEELLNIQECVKDGTISSNIAERMVMKVAEKHNQSNESTWLAKGSLNHIGVDRSFKGVMFTERSGYRDSMFSEQHISSSKEAIQSCKVETENEQLNSVNKQRKQMNNKINQSIEEFNVLVRKDSIDAYNQERDIISSHITYIVENYGASDEITPYFNEGMCNGSIEMIKGAKDRIAKLDLDIDYDQAQAKARAILEQLDNAIAQNNDLIQQTVSDVSVCDRVAQLAERTQEMGKNNPDLGDCLKGCLREVRDSFSRNNDGLKPAQWPDEFKDSLKSAVNTTNMMSENVQTQDNALQKGV